MTAKQNKGLYAPDGSKYAVPTNGVNTLGDTLHTTATIAKQNKGARAPDGSIYFCLTDGNGNLT